MARLRTLVIGTRGSPLALAQAEIVANLLQKENSNLRIFIKKIKTDGDVRFRSRNSIGKDLFTKKIDQALKNGEIDIAVHSLKDVPLESKFNAEIEIASYPKREDPRDVLISKNLYNLETLPRNATVGTSSTRRAIQLKAVRSDVRILELHGNVGTRLDRLDSSGMDAILLARAGLNRLRRIVGGVNIPAELMIPAAGQGCLAVTIRSSDQETRRIVRSLDDKNTRAAATAERTFSKSIGGGCNSPTAAHAVVRGNDLTLTGLIEIPGMGEARSFSRESIEGPASAAATLGAKLATILTLRNAFRSKDTPEGQENLMGRIFLITRTDEGNLDLRRSLEKFGAKVIDFPTIRIQSLRSQRFGKIFSNSAGFDWIVFTSAVGVRIFFDRLSELDAKSRLHRKVFARAKFACVGPATERALLEFGLRCSALPREFLTRDLGHLLAEKNIAGKRILLARAKNANRSICRILSKSGATVTQLSLYETLPNKGRIPYLNEITDLTLTSPSTVEGLLASTSAKELNNSGVAIHCIGPVTAAHARERGLYLNTVAKTHTIDGLINAVLEKLPKQRRSVLGLS